MMLKEWILKTINVCLETVFAVMNNFKQVLSLQTDCLIVMQSAETNDGFKHTEQCKEEILIICFQNMIE